MKRNRRSRAYCFENELHYKQLYVSFVRAWFVHKEVGGCCFIPVLSIPHSPLSEDEGLWRKVW